MSNPAIATRQYWLAHHHFAGYTWVLSPTVIHETLRGQTIPVPNQPTDEYNITLHVPQTDDYVFFSVNTLERAKEYVQLLCPKAPLLQWQHFPDQKEAARYLREYVLANPTLSAFRRHVMMCLPFTGTADVSTGLAPKVAMQHGGPPPDWRREDSFDVWERVALTLDTVLQEHRHSQGVNLCNVSGFRDAVTQYFKPLVGNSANKALLEHIDAAFQKHAPLLYEWKDFLWKARNEFVHPGSPHVGLVGLSATLVLVRTTIRAWYFGSTPLDEQTYPLSESDSIVLLLAPMEKPN